MGGGHNLRLIFHKQTVDEIFGFLRDIVECLVLVIVFSDGHIGHGLQVRVAHKRRQTRHPAKHSQNLSPGF